MKKLLFATTALALAGGGGGQTLAEIAISGDARKLGFRLQLQSERKRSRSTASSTRWASTSPGSGTTDGGLSFGGTAGFDTGAETTNEGTVSSSAAAFGTITFGNNDSADKLSGGIADVGLNGIGVDDVVEDIYGTTANQFRYDQSVGSIALAISAGTSPGDGRGGECSFDLGANGTLVFNRSGLRKGASRSRRTPMRSA